MNTLKHTPRADAGDSNAHRYSVLLAAALFMGCMLAEAQAGSPAGAEPVAAPQAVARPAAAIQDSRQFNEAVRLFRGGRWSAAYGRFMALADRGHVRAARIALAMHRDGPSKYGALWDATPAQQQAWERAAGGEPAPLLVLNR